MLFHLLMKHPTLLSQAQTNDRQGHLEDLLYFVCALVIICAVFGLLTVLADYIEKKQ